MKKTLLIGEPAAREYGKALAAYGYDVIPLPPDERLNRIVNSHADTLICRTASSLIINEHYLSALPAPLHEHFTAVAESPHGSYPTDTAFNALKLGRVIFAREESLARAVRNAARLEGTELVSVRQGYARCAVLPLGAALSAITSDEGMAKAMELRGINTLRIAPGSIALEGCEYGFIGGASFVDEPESCCSLHTAPTVCFFGSLAYHPDGWHIRSFIESRGYEIIELGGPLRDFGGGIVLG